MGTEVGKVGGGSQGGWEVATADPRCEPLLSADTSGRAAVGLQHTLPSRPPATSTRAVSSFQLITNDTAFVLQDPRSLVCP